MTLETNPRPFQLQQHSDESRLIPECRLIALGRYHNDDADEDDHSDIMVANGEFSVALGGPVINGNGEVVGVNFFAINFTPFLPINIVSKWWEHLKKFGEYRRPWLGMELSNLFVVELHILEDIIQKIPDIKEGVIVDKVTPNSPAGSVGVESGDIIIACDGKHVKGFLQVY
ncbi:hypothetical protein C2S53_016138 [Perilla frutescens var. hirtella]|uniref:PDZ domain-containing protein n=1 Tax=Perilla frutescens var. hirtella TaxID=608512 RepID=A0AAD4J5I2_PERFH|nr:hypothetical protein C2S53_016138 [Perilla frutescens var. hirtella]